MSHAFLQRVHFRKVNLQFFVYMN